MQALCGGCGFSNALLLAEQQQHECRLLNTPWYMVYLELKIALVSKHIMLVKLGVAMGSFMSVVMSDFFFLNVSWL